MKRLAILMAALCIGAAKKEVPHPTPTPEIQVTGRKIPAALPALEINADSAADFVPMIPNRLAVGRLTATLTPTPATQADVTSAAAASRAIRRRLNLNNTIPRPEAQYVHDTLLNNAMSMRTATEFGLTTATKEIRWLEDQLSEMGDLKP